MSHPSPRWPSATTALGMAFALAPICLAPAPTARADDAPTKWLNPVKGSATDGRFVSHLSAGFSGGSNPSGASSQAWNAQADTLRTTDTESFRADAAWFYSTADRNGSRSSAQFHAMQDWRPWRGSGWLLFARAETQHDTQRAWNWRVGAYGGAGHTLLDDDKWEVVGRGGLGGRYDFGDANAFTPEAVLGGSAIGWKIARNQKVVGEGLAYKSLDDADAWRFSGKAEWQIRLSDEQKTMLKIGVRDQYESLRPAGQKGHDLQYYVGVGVELP